MEETVGLGAVEQGETKKAETRHWERRRKKDTEKERTLPVLLFPPKCCISDLLTFTCQSPFVNRYLNSFIPCIMSKCDSKHLLYLHVVKVKKIIYTRRKVELVVVMGLTVAFSLISLLPAEACHL